MLSLNNPIKDNSEMEAYLMILAFSGELLNSYSFIRSQRFEE